MKKIVTLAYLSIGVLTLWAAGAAADPSVNTVAAGGYDLVSYQTGTPVRGNGKAIVEYKDATYLFASEEHKKLFAANPEKYLPAYGGYCAYGASFGKKFDGDPNVWEIVDGKLYFNVTPEVKLKWREDIKGNIHKADAFWPQIKDKPASSL